ncbi:MAG TPA: hypothetical protein VFV80_11485 [Geminicoccaceae bacterium]|nr:hypothetical protein [Geminicoccaceae bacterium]
MLDHREVGARLDVRIEQQRLVLRGEQQPTGHRPREIERLAADEVARQDQLATCGIPQGTGEHAVELGKGALSELGVERQDQVDIGFQRSAAGSIEALAQPRAVVQLEIADDGVAVVAGRSRSAAREDTSQAHMLGGLQKELVIATMAQPLRHRRHGVRTRCGECAENPRHADLSLGAPTQPPPRCAEPCPYGRRCPRRAQLFGESPSSARTA